MFDVIYTWVEWFAMHALTPTQNIKQKVANFLNLYVQFFNPVYISFLRLETSHSNNMPIRKKTYLQIIVRKQL